MKFRTSALFRWCVFVSLCILGYCTVLVHSYQVVRQTQPTLYGTSSTFQNQKPKLSIPYLNGKSRKRFSVVLAATSKSKKTTRDGGATGFGSKATSKRIKDDTSSQGGQSSTDTQRGVEDSTIVQLDKWGLPPPTLEDIFPLMSTDTEITPVDSTVQYTANDTTICLKNFYPNNINWNYVTMAGLFDHNDVIKDVSSEHAKMKLRLAHRSPPVLVIDNFLSEKECNDVKRIVTENGNNNVEEGNDTIIRVASKTISQQLALSKRTSTSWFCSYQSIPTVLAKLQHILGVHDLSQCEEPQIVRYDIGQEFTYHYDIIPKEQTSNGGQRVATILIYLNSISKENGGGTTFRDLTNGDSKNTTLSVQPVQGSALIFFPSNQWGQPDDRTLHCSLPMIQDQNDKSDASLLLTSKWILQIWIHETSYTACLPSNQNRIEDAYIDINAASQQFGYI